MKKWRKQEDRRYDRKLSDLHDRLDKMYDNIDDVERGQMDNVIHVETVMLPTKG